MKLITKIFWLTATLFITSCTYTTQGLLNDENRNAKIIENDVFGDSAKRIVYLEQNWDRYDSLWFYNTTQGSDLMPYEIFLYLEQADQQAPFRSDENINKYRFLAQEPSFDNPDGLPVGFVQDTFQGYNYIGFTCAACHTGQINYKGTGIRVDGAPTLGDFEGLFDSLVTALKTTLDNPAKFDRLAAKMIELKYSTSKFQFRGQLQAVYEQRKNYNELNAPLHGNELVAYGYGRLDAFGRIYNRVLEHLVEPGLTNANPANAPVSYPFLWDTPQSDFVQWNGIGDNNSGGGFAGLLGPLGRNTGEVLGVFATFDLSKEGRKGGYVSSAVTRNLNRLERQLIYLESPLWPEDILPPIDQPLASKGSDVFYRYECDACHTDPKTFDRTSSERRVIAQFSSLDLIGTDRTMADNALNRTGLSGYFNGQPISDSSPIPTFPRKKMSVLPALSKAGEGVIKEPDPDKGIIRGSIEKLADLIMAGFDNPIKNKTQRHVDFEVIPSDPTPESLLVYKGRSLNGIWATAPYLHNGSVPNLYELFLPKCSDQEIAAGKPCRSNKFTVGSREYDPKKVGYQTKDKSQYPRLFEFDTSKPSNSNAGHEYAAGVTPIIKRDSNGRPMRDANGKFIRKWFDPISEEDRLALVEYLKTL